MKSLRVAALGAAVCLMAAPAAHAVATASAAITDFQYELFALSPGVLPSVTFDTGASISTQAYDGVTYPTYQYVSGPAGAALTVSSTAGVNTATGSTTAGSLTGTPGGGPGASAFATASGPGSWSNGYAETLNTAFTLSPYTLIVFTVDTSGLAAAAAAGESALASSYLFITDSAGTQFSLAESSVSVDQYGTTSALAPTLTASFVNLSGTPVTGNAAVVATAFAYGVSAVPEPTSSSMLLLGGMGMGMLALGRRRR